MMPYTMPFSGQKYKWISLIFMAGLPFFVLYRWMKGDLPYIENPNRKIVKKIYDSSDD